MIEPHIIDLPMWIQLAGSAACFRILFFMADFSDKAVPGSGWVGHQGENNG